MRMFRPFLLFLVMVTSFSGVDLCWFGPPQPSRPPPSGTGPCCMYLHIWAMKTLKLCKGGWVDEAHTTVCRPLPLCRFESKYHTVTMMMLTCWWWNTRIMKLLIWWRRGYNNWWSPGTVQDANVGTTVSWGRILIISEFEIYHPWLQSTDDNPR